MSERDLDLATYDACNNKMKESKAAFDAWFRCNGCGGPPGLENKLIKGSTDEGFWRVLWNGKPMILCKQCVIKRGLLW